MKPDLAAWEPFEPTANEPWDLKKVAHFHRRAGFGASWAVLHRDLEAGPGAALDRLLNSPAETTETQGNLAGLRAGIREAPDYRQRLQAYWMYRLVFDPNPLRENMTLFWHNHFATSNAKVGDEFQMVQQNELLRSNSLGDLRLLLEGVLSDAAMLIWLDGTNNPKARPNENLAREFLELFALGVGNYTEADVREAARAITGWVSSPSQGPGLRYEPRKLEFKVSEFDDGDKRIFGREGRFGRADLVRLVLEQSACAVFISRKLYRHFVRDDIEPEPELIEPLADALRASGYSIRRIVGMILRSRHFYSESVHRRRIASPVELCVGLLRTFGVPEIRGSAPGGRRGVSRAGTAPLLPTQRRRMGRRAAMDHERQNGRADQLALGRDLGRSSRVTCRRSIRSRGASKTAFHAERSARRSSTCSSRAT